MGREDRTRRLSDERRAEIERREKADAIATEQRENRPRRVDDPRRDGEIRRHLEKENPS